MPITVPSKPFVPTEYTTTPAEVVGVALDALNHLAVLKTGASADGLGRFSQIKSVQYRASFGAQQGNVAINADFQDNEFQIWRVEGALIPIFIAPPVQGRGLLLLIQDAVGNRTVTWPSEVRWQFPFSAPTLTTSANGVDIFEFVLWNNTAGGGWNYFARRVLNYNYV